MTLVVRGGRVVVDGGLVEADVTIDDGGRIAAVQPSAAGTGSDVSAGADQPGRPDGPGRPDELDATGCVVAPGFVDLQVNGAGGIDLTAEPERLWEVAALLPRWGVTSWLPTIVTSPEPVRERALATLRQGPPDPPDPSDLSGAAPAAPVATPLGLHLEGPFLNPERKGAHVAAHLRSPDPALIAGWSRDAGVALVTLAPELPGALDLVRALVDRGVVVSLGHSSASTEEATAGVDAGARWATHLFNAMPPLHHRDPGLAGVALTDERLRVGLIADGLHVHPRMVRLAARALGARLTLVTDAVAALGVPPGPIRLGDLEALAAEDGVRLPDGTLAGSNLAMATAVANLQAFAGVDLGAAVHAAATAPAAVLGRAGERGVVAPGAVGDLVVLDGDGRVVATVIGGRVARGPDAPGGRELPGAGGSEGGASWRS
ncbi:MAG TPA: N-acetylglucosamine-6-phosphate deacetylase [Acidimicrobiales bacterium]